MVIFLLAVKERKWQPTGECSESSVGGEKDVQEKQAREVGMDGVKTDRNIYIDTVSRAGVTSLSH